MRQAFKTCSYEILIFCMYRRREHRIAVFAGFRSTEGGYDLSINRKFGEIVEWTA